MIKLIALILLAALMIAGFGMVIMREPGFAVFSYGDTTVEVELVKFYFAAVAGFIALYFFFRILSGLFHIPARMQAQREQKILQEVMQSLESSIVDYSQLNWEAAIKNTTRHIKKSPIKKVQHLMTAYCAHNAKQKDMRNSHVSSLRNLENCKSLANTIESEFTLADGKPERAIGILTDESTDNISNANTLANAYIQTGNRYELEKLLPKLNLHTQKSSRVKTTINQSIHWLIGQYDLNNKIEKLSELWKTYSKSISSDKALLHAYVHALTKNRCDVLAEQIIRTELEHDWDETLITEYGLLSIDNFESRTKQAEAWINDHKESAGLYLTLGRLLKKQKLWGKAKMYLESSLSRRPLAATYAELVELHEELDETIDAQRCARKGLHLATRQ